MNLASAFADSVQKNSEKTALFWGERTFSYSEIWTQAVFVAGVLQQQFNVQPGDRIGLWLKNCPEFIPALFGILHSGAVAVPINNFLKPDEVSFILADAGIDVILTDSDLSAHFQILKKARTSLKLANVESMLASFPVPPENLRFETEILRNPSRAQGDLALLIYTSGTTGRPKGAMLSHGNLLHNVESCRQVLAAVDFDRFVLLLPMFHSFMLCVCIVLPLYVGGSIVLIKSLHPPKNVIQEIVLRQATILPAIPQFFRTLADSPSRCNCRCGCASAVRRRCPARCCRISGAILASRSSKVTA